MLGQEVFCGLDTAAGCKHLDEGLRVLAAFGLGAVDDLVHRLAEHCQGPGDSPHFSSWEVGSTSDRRFLQEEAHPRAPVMFNAPNINSSSLGRSGNSNY